MIYLLKCGPYLKVGFTGGSFAAYLQWVRNRIPFQVDVLATTPGTKDQEQELHREIKEYRHDLGGREWYVDSQELRLQLDRFFFADREVSYEPEILPAAGEIATGTPEGLSYVEQVPSSEFDA